MSSSRFQASWRDRSGARTVVGTALVRADRRTLARVPLLLAKALPAVSPLTIAARFVMRPFTLVPIVLLLVAAAGLMVRRRARYEAQSSGRSGASMIITVTLNAALDKTLEVPNFTPGRASDR